jgi:predicted kinase
MKSGKPSSYLRIGIFPYFMIRVDGFSTNPTGEYANLKFFIHESSGTRHKRYKTCPRKEWEGFLDFIFYPNSSQVVVRLNKNCGELKIGPLDDGNALFEYSIQADTRGSALNGSRWVSLDDIWLPWSADPIPYRGPKAVILIGIPASGKSTFCRRRFFGAYTQISRDIMKTWNREQLLLNECIHKRHSFVVDNTNVRIVERERFITPARDEGYKIIGYYFSSKVQDALERNLQREGDARIPDKGVLGRAAQLELPTMAEGFDELWFVRMDGNGSFIIEEWNDAL